MALDNSAEDTKLLFSCLEDEKIPLSVNAYEIQKMDKLYREKALTLFKFIEKLSVWLCEKYQNNIYFPNEDKIRLTNFILQLGQSFYEDFIITPFDKFQIIVYFHRHNQNRWILDKLEYRDWNEMKLEWFTKKYCPDSPDSEIQKYLNMK